MGRLFHDSKMTFYEFPCTVGAFKGQKWKNGKLKKGVCFDQTCTVSSSVGDPDPDPRIRIIPFSEIMLAK
jgi:hypothetical protein